MILWLKHGIVLRRVLYMSHQTTQPSTNYNPQPYAYHYYCCSVSSPPSRCWLWPSHAYHIRSMITTTPHTTIGSHATALDLRQPPHHAPLLAPSPPNSCKLPHSTSSSFQLWPLSSYFCHHHQSSSEWALDQCQVGEDMGETMVERNEERKGLSNRGRGRWEGKMGALGLDEGKGRRSIKA